MTSMLPNRLLLPEGPWKVVGNTVKDGAGRTVAVVHAKHADAVAHWIAHLPEMTDGEEALVSTRAKLIEVTEESEGLERIVGELEAEVGRLKAKLAAKKPKGP